MDYLYGPNIGVQMQMVGFGVEIIFGEAFSGSSNHCHAKQAIQFETNPEFFFWFSAFLCRAPSAIIMKIGLSEALLPI